MAEAVTPNDRSRERLRGLSLTQSAADPGWLRPARRSLRSPDESAAHRQNVPRRRGWLLRRLLLLADFFGLLAAFLIAQHVFTPEYSDKYSGWVEVLLFFAVLPFWVVTANLVGLYDRDDERTDHSTADDLVGVFAVVTVGTWLASVAAWLTNVVDPDPPRMMAFWAFAITLVVLFRILARAAARRSVTYLQNTIIVGAGDVGQLVARKIVQHPEYGLNLVGFVDSEPRARRSDLGDLALLGSPEQLRDLVRFLDVDRIVIAFSNDAHDETLALVRSMRELGVQVDVVPRLFEIVGPKVHVHTVEGLPLLGLAPARLSPSARLLKRTIDLLFASLGLLLLAPLFAFVALRIKRDSPGPVFFRQRRLGLNMGEFEAIKFRTMYVDTDVSIHRDYIRSTMSASAIPVANGIYKLNRDDAITPFGRWLRKTSLDELPQLINVVRGEMSLVGPRPCIEYETENFAPHHFERFLVPPGITGLWQVTARARSTFGEALDMDVSYARGWSLGLDLRLLCRTPLAVLRQRRATA